MDSITQGLLGAAIADAAFRKRLGPKATIFGAACALLPDTDLLARVGGEWSSLTWHRGPTHSVFVLAAAAPVLGYLAWRAAGRTASWRSWAHLAFWALITHPLLDLCTSYGTPLFWPLTDHRYATDAVGIIDPFYTIPLLLAVIAMRFARVRERSGPALAAGALIATTLYLAAGFTLSQLVAKRVVSTLAAETGEEAFAPLRIRAMPFPFSLLVWRVVAQNAAGDVHVETVSLAYDGPRLWYRVDSADDPLVERALDSERGRLWRWFASDFMTARVEHNADGARVYFSDQRYGGIADPGVTAFGAVATFDGAGRLISFERARHGRGWRSESAALWNLMRGRAPGLPGMAGGGGEGAEALDTDLSAGRIEVPPVRKHSGDATVESEEAR